MPPTTTDEVLDPPRPLADYLAGLLDLGGVGRLMDLSGGSGALALALLEHYPDLTAVVVNLPAVCAAGFETTLTDRLAVPGWEARRAVSELGRIEAIKKPAAEMVGNPARETR